jgi:hypothetical protein
MSAVRAVGRAAAVEPPAVELNPQRGAAAGAVCAIILPAATVVLHLVGPDYGRVQMWGADFWAFLPLWSCGLSVVGVTLAAWPLIQWLVASIRMPVTILTAPASGQSPAVRAGSATRGRHPLA